MTLRDARCPVGQFLEHHLPHRKRLQASVAQNTGVEFTPLDEFLGDSVRAEMAVDELDTLGEFVVRGHDRCMGDAE